MVMYEDNSRNIHGTPMQKSEISFKNKTPSSDEQRDIQITKCKEDLKGLQQHDRCRPESTSEMI